MTAASSSCVPFSVATATLSPAARCRWMFSTMTMESSMTSPMAMARPPIDIRLMVPPTRSQDEERADDRERQRDGRDGRHAPVAQEEDQDEDGQQARRWRSRRARWPRRCGRTRRGRRRRSASPRAAATARYSVSAALAPSTTARMLPRICRATLTTAAGLPPPEMSVVRSMTPSRTSAMSPTYTGVCSRNATTTFRTSSRLVSSAVLRTRYCR